MSYIEDERPRGSARAKEILNTLERTYLAAIRAVVLVAATVMVIYAILLAASGFYQTSRDVGSVSEQQAIVSPEEVTEIDLNKVTKARTVSKSDQLSAEKRYYADFAKRYYAVFQRGFERFKKPEDQLLDLKAFDQRYVQTGDRLAAIKGGVGNFEGDKADLESLLTTMSTVASSPKTIERLQAYRSAKKTKVTRTEAGTRQETYCSYYGVYIDACLSYDTRTVPYSRSIEEMKLPTGVISHAGLFGAYQDRYLSMLAEKREANAAEAERKREEIMADNESGKARLWFALSVVGGFLVLMFLFLLIALERHQRKIAASATSLE